jgi:[ribosomal protein S5]-alanine N-acetyltransferase
MEPVLPSDSPVKPLPLLETSRLLLRPLRLDDAVDMYEYASDQDVAHAGLWQPLASLDASLADIRQVLHEYAMHTLWDWAIEHRADHKMIGRIGLSHYHPGDQRADLGYALNRRYWSKGYATEAAQTVLRYAFRDLRLNRVGALVLPDNAGSIRVLGKIGMKREGLRREFTWLRGKADDLVCYSILRREWLADQTAETEQVSE